jgi:hypothetical protein
MTVRKKQKTKASKASSNGNGTVKANHGFIHVVTPATASQIRKTLRIRKIQVQNVLRAFEAAGVPI